MLRPALFGLLLLCAVACDSPQRRAECQQVKTGHFLFRHNEPGFKYGAFIDRTDSLQMETDQLTGDISKLAVKWLNDCEYELRLISSTKPFPDSIQHLRKTVPLHTEILGVTDQYYLFKSYRDNPNLALTDTMWIRQ